MTLPADPATTIATATHRTEAATSAGSRPERLCAAVYTVAPNRGSQSRTQVLADRAAALLFYVATGTAALTALVWSLAGEGDERSPGSSRC